MEADHVSICKFENADGSDYENVLSGLKPLAKKAVEMHLDRREAEIASKATELVPIDPAAVPEACSRGDMEAVKSLAASGVDINTVDARGATPLMIAIEKENISIVDLLLSMGAKPNFVTTSEKTPLGLAIDKRNVEVAGLLLGNGTDLTENNTESTFLRYHPVGQAVQLGDEAMVKLFFEKGADANGLPKKKKKNSRFRWTPMHVVMKSTKEEGVIKALLEHGAEIDRKDSLGKTSVDYFQPVL
jgi:uncharacterized protein